MYLGYFGAVDDIWREIYLLKFEKGIVEKLGIVVECYMVVVGKDFQRKS